jgi:outer membrane protein TolC
MSVRRKLASVLLALGAVSVLPALPARADDEPAPSVKGAEEAAKLPPRRRGYTLQQCVSFAERNYPTIAQARAKASFYRAQLDEARSAPFSQWKATAGVALAPTSRGTSVYSPDTDVALKSSMGLAWRTTIEGAIPLFTFGKISNLIDAAENQVELGEHQVAKERNQVRLDVRKAYFGLLLARSSVDLLGEASSRLDKAIDKLAKQVDDGEADEFDLFKLQTYRAEVDARTAEAKRYESIALVSLAFLTGVQTGFEVSSDTLEPADHVLGPVARYLQAARIHRPEINMARAGIRAREAQASLARAKMYPDLALGMSAGWTRAPEIDDQLNPYVKDNANYVSLGFGLVMQWNLDLLPAAARLEQARAQLEETRAIERMALGGVGVEVETAYAEVISARRREEAYGRAEGLAKKWLIGVQQGIDLGTEEEKALTDPAKEYAQQRFNHLNAIMDLNVAMSKLALVTGWDAIAPKG